MIAGAGSTPGSAAERTPAATVVPEQLGRAWRWPPSRPATFALVIGLLITAALTLISLAVYNRNERRLLNLRVRELSLLVASTAPTVQTPLASAAELANATGGSPQKFRAFMAPYIGTGQGRFASISLWPLRSRRPKPVVVLGAPPILPTMPDQASAFVLRPKRTGVLNMTPILDSKTPSVGFVFSAPAQERGFAVYAENRLPANRRSALERNSAFSDLNYALYFGHSRKTPDVLVTSEKRLPIKGRTATQVVPFGAAAFTLVVAPKGSLGGSFFKSLPWIIAGVGVLATLIAALVTDRLQRRRQRAEQLAGLLDRVAAENRRLYTEQRGIAQTLQHALLPERLPDLKGLRAGARYVPAATGVDVGGDWYDLVAVDDRRVLLVIGDVSGHGLRAATTMALLRHAVLAYVAQDHRPATVLQKLADFVTLSPHDYFATVLCALIDVDAHHLTLSSAGHMAPLVVVEGRADFADLRVGAPIGVARNGHYEETTMPVPPRAMVLAFTDGLVERRGEVIDVGLARLRRLATSSRLSLDDLLSRLAQDLTSEDHHDDTAMVGIQWQS
jgi:serine phosphatase RsbU (regulator of sigma subunit)